MNYSEYLELINEKKKICIFGAGVLGRGDGYYFLKNMLGYEQQINYFCDNYLQADTLVVDNIKTIEISYLYEHADEIVCVIVVNGKVLYEIKEQLECHNLKVYTLDDCDIFKLCNEIMQIGNEFLVSKVRNFFREKKYEFQIETSSFCNAKCTFCSNASLKRKKNIMSHEVFNRIIERIKLEKINVSKFILCLNGEPLTDPQLFMRIKKLKSEFPYTKVEFTSNFALATDEIIEQILESNLDKVICSLNSVNEKKYKKIMGLEYEKTVNNIEYLLRRKKETGSKLEICLSIILNEENVDEVQKFKERWRGVNIRVMKLGQWVDKEMFQTIYNHERNGICPILYRTINILSNGDYALCCFDSEGIISYNVMDSTIEEAWKSSVFKNIREWHLEHGKTNRECANCSF